MPDQVNYFTNELHQYFLGQGKNLSEKVMGILSKTYAELSDDEISTFQNIVIPTSSSIKKGLLARIEEQRIEETAWFEQLSIFSQTNIGKLANEVAFEKWGRQYNGSEPAIESVATDTSDKPSYCKKCGSPTEKAAVFCGNCGAKIGNGREAAGELAHDVHPEPSPLETPTPVVGLPQSNPSYQEIGRLLQNYYQSRDAYYLHLGQNAYGMIMAGSLDIFGGKNPKEEINNIYNQYARGDYNIFLSYLGQMTYQQYLEGKIADASLSNICSTLYSTNSHIPYLEIGTYAIDPSKVERVLLRPTGNTAIPQYVGGHPSLPDKKNSPYSTSHLTNLITADGLLLIASLNEIIFSIQLTDLLSIRTSTGLFNTFGSRDESYGYCKGMIDQFIKDSRGKRVLAIEAIDTTHRSIAALFSYGGSKISLDAFVAQDIEVLNSEVSKWMNM